MSDPVVIYFDGACEPTNPGGFACWAWVALDRQGNEVGCDYGCIGHGPAMTNNLAEYTALTRALAWLDERDVMGITVRGDSQLVVNQVAGSWACNASHLRTLRDEARRIIARLNLKLEWIPRERNVRADGYSRQAYAEMRHGTRR